MYFFVDIMVLHTQQLQYSVNVTFVCTGKPKNCDVCLIEMFASQQWSCNIAQVCLYLKLRHRFHHLIIPFISPVPDGYLSYSQCLLQETVTITTNAVCISLWISADSLGYIPRNRIAESWSMYIFKFIANCATRVQHQLIVPLALYSNSCPSTSWPTCSIVTLQNLCCYGLCDTVLCCFTLYFPDNG